jgi:hypothetical protein
MAIESTFEILKKEADELNIQYHPNISEEKLGERVAEYKKQKQVERQIENEPVTVNKKIKGKKQLTPKEFEQVKRENARKEAAKLIRCRVTCMDPNKKDYEGEILTVSNSFCGTHRKFIPYDGREWHIPQIILNMMKEKQCQVFYTVSDKRGNKTRKGKLIKAYAIEELDPLTKEELNELAELQLKTGTAD